MLNWKKNTREEEKQLYELLWRFKNNLFLLFLFQDGYMWARQQWLIHLHLFSMKQVINWIIFDTFYTIFCFIDLLELSHLATL